ncbi:MAG: ISNCY family transposase, partial [Candidatus Kerfeldbacteria bacterium]|nr:ISNCY family transposase [Candidatus Kerfeldbacteria bacterium]
NHQLATEMLEQALGALHNPLWKGFGPQFATEKLEVLHGIRVSTWTVRKLMIKSELWRRARPGKKHRSWRPRRLCMGMLTQLDGSEHDWLEGRGPRCVLLIYIDDATSQILYGEFVKVEDTLTLMRATKTYLEKWGRPVAFYVDKDSIYRVNRQASIDEQLRDEYPMTQFARAMSELDVDVIAADSPQAKGRVERSFDTHQDRLVKELRLRGISTMEAANRYLWDQYIPEHNARFAIEPANASNMHRPLLPSHDLNEILSLRTERTVFNDFTVRFKSRFLQVLPDQPVRVRPKDKVLVEVRLDASMHLRLKDCYLAFKTLAKRPERPPERSSLPGPGSPIRRYYKPAKDHPWRRYGMQVWQPALHEFIPTPTTK